MTGRFSAPSCSSAGATFNPRNVRILLSGHPEAPTPAETRKGSIATEMTDDTLYIECVCACALLGNEVSKIRRVSKTQRGAS